MHTLKRLSRFVVTVGPMGEGRILIGGIWLFVLLVVGTMVTWPAALVAQSFPQLPEDYSGEVDDSSPTPPKECPLYSGTILETGLGFEAGVPIDSVKTHEEGLECLTNLLDSIEVECQGEVELWALSQQDYDLYYKDDCFANKLLEVFTGKMAWQLADENFDGTVYFDSNCVPLDRNSANLTGACDAISIEWWASPISLLLDENVDLESDPSIVSFPLDARRGTGYYVWKASDKAPLLVFDPEHTGEISSAAQLFGNWTFGGKRLALAADSDALGQAGPWENGFEALATLDSDRSGSVNGSELDVLGLWYDKNRDGVSQPGEVESVREAGIKHIFFDVDSKDAATGSLYVTHGFERIKDGEMVSGKAVDWYGASGDSKLELIARENARGVVCGSAPEGLPEASQLENAPVAPPAADNKVEPHELTGLWRWKVVNADGNESEASGILSFWAAEGKKLQGGSFVELPFKKGAVENMRSMVSAHRIAHIEADPGLGKRHYRFTANGTQSITDNAVKLSSDGSKLFGESTTTLTSKTGGIQSHKYRWVATRAGR